MEENLDINNEVNNEISDNITKPNSEEIKETKSEKDTSLNRDNGNSQSNSTPKIDIKNETNNTPVKTIIKPKKELPIEKKPFQEFINTHLIPALTEEINQRGLEMKKINLTNTNRPIAGDKCWVINCEIKDTCNFWLSFEKEDISSLKSISLSKPNQKPSIIESFLIDEKRITLKLIISRVLQRLNGQKLIGVN